MRGLDKSSTASSTSRENLNQRPAQGRKTRNSQRAGLISGLVQNPKFTSTRNSKKIAETLEIDTEHLETQTQNIDTDILFPFEDSEISELYPNSRPLTKMVNYKMPNPLSNDAPSWDGSQPETLKEFIYKVTRCFELAQVTTDAEKLKWILSYVSPDVRDEWSSFDEVENDKWDGFIERLKREYPEMISKEQGSMQALWDICRKYRDIGINEEGTLLAFKRKFMVEATKCLKPPALVSNRELVELFTNSLDPHFRTLLDERLSLMTSSRASQAVPAVAAAQPGQQGQPGNNPVAQIKIIRGDDPYDLNVVIEKAKDLVSGKTLSRSLTTDSRDYRQNSVDRKQSPFERGNSVARNSEVKEEISQLHGEVAVMKDMLTTQEKMIKTYFEGLANMQSVQRQAQQNRERPSAYVPSQLPQNRSCFYCGEPGHGVLACSKKERDLQLGRIRIEGNYVRLPDGSQIPQGTGTLQERVERFYQTREQHMYSMSDLPPGMLEIPELGNTQNSVFLNKIRDPREQQYLDHQSQLLEAKEAELRNLRNRMTMLENIMAPQFLQQSPRESVVPVTKSQSQNSDVAELTAQLNQLQAKLSKMHNSGIESQMLETRATAKTKSDAGF